MLVNKCCAVEGRLEKGKAVLGLTTLSCSFLFFNRYLLPCRHIFYENMYGSTKLLTPAVWRKFQQMFDEVGFDVYIHREVIDLKVPRMTEVEKIMENQTSAD